MTPSHPAQQDEMPSAKRKRILDASDGFTEPKEYVLASDYDALRARCERLAQDLKNAQWRCEQFQTRNGQLNTLLDNVREDLRVAQIALENMRQWKERAESAESRLAALQEENQRFRNGFVNLMTMLHEAPGLPLEAMGEKDLEEWTNVITGLLMALGILETTGKPMGMWEALMDAAALKSNPTAPDERGSG